MDDEGFVCCKYADDIHLSLDVARLCVEARLSFYEGNSYPLLVDMKGIKSTSQRARDYLASVGIVQVKAGAFVTGSAMNRIIGNIFLTIDKPAVPSKLFSDETSAREWLKQYV
jgi:hypothetical protein